MRHDDSTPKPNGRASIMIQVEAPRPLLDEGEFSAECIDASCAWSRRWSKWICILTFRLIDYQGRAYTGQLCKFLALGTDRRAPHAGSQSAFRRLWVEVNGDQPTASEIDLALFVGSRFHVQVETVRTKADQAKTPIDPVHQYSVVRKISFCKPNERTREPRQHSNPTNTRTREHSNTGNTPNPSNTNNTSTLKPTLQHPNTYNPLTPGVPSSAGDVPDSVGDDFEFGEVGLVEDCIPNDARQGAESKRSKSATTPRSHHNVKGKKK